MPLWYIRLFVDCEMLWMQKELLHFQTLEYPQFYCLWKDTNDGGAGGGIKNIFKVFFSQL